MNDEGFLMVDIDLSIPPSWRKQASYMIVPIGINIFLFK